MKKEILIGTLALVIIALCSAQAQSLELVDNLYPEQHVYEFYDTHVTITGRCRTIIYKGDWPGKLHTGELEYVDAIVSKHDGLEAHLDVVVRAKTPDGDILFSADLKDGGIGSNYAYDGVFYWGSVTGYAKYATPTYLSYYAEMTTVRVGKIYTTVFGGKK